MQVLLRMLCAIPAHILVVSLFRRGDIAMTNGIARLVLKWLVLILRRVVNVEVMRYSDKVLEVSNGTGRSDYGQW